MIMKNNGNKKTSMAVRIICIILCVLLAAGAIVSAIGIL